MTVEAIMDSEQRCDLTELIVAQCAHCRRPPAAPRFREALLDDPGGDDDVVTFRARYDGRCELCDDLFEAGDEISRTSGGDYICSDCGQEDE